MPDTTITYFPVGNGDTTLIKLADGTTVIIDLNVTEDSQDEDDDSRYDVHGHLIKEVRKDGSGRPHADVFLLTHPDQDHIRAFSTVFYSGDPGKYSEKDQRQDRIIVDEVWFAPRLFWEGRDLSDDAKAFKKEVDRRIVVYRKGGAERNLPGNRVRIIGFSDNPELKGLEAIITVPGNTTNVINGSAKDGFEFFVHGPFKKETDADGDERNDTSIVLQARFAVGGVKTAALAFFGGDAGCTIWEDIIARSKTEDLLWDLFLAPHHCSWTFFSELPSEEEEPSEKILALLKSKKRTGAVVISSSKPIKDDENNPPHYIAAETYRSTVGKDRFLCTGEHPSESKPIPIYFRMTQNGPQKDDYPKGSQVVSSAALKSTVATPKTYG